MVTYDQQSSRSGRFLGGRTVDRSPSQESIGDTTGKTSWGTLIKDELKMPDADTIDSRDAQRQPLDAESSSGLPTPPTIGEPPKAPTNNSQFQWRKYQQRLAAWQVEKKAQVEQYELERSAAMDQKRATIQGRQFEIQEADRIAEIEAADLASTLKERTEGEVLGALQAIRGIDGKSPDFQDRISEIMLEYPNGITDPRVKTIIDFHSKTNQAVTAARKAEEEKKAQQDAESEKSLTEARKTAASEGLNQEELASAFPNNTLDPVAFEAARRAAKERQSRARRSSANTETQDKAIDQLKEERAALQARLESSDLDSPEMDRLRSSLTAIDAKIKFRQEQRTSETMDDTSDSSAQFNADGEDSNGVLSLEEMKRRHEAGTAVNGTEFYDKNGVKMTYENKDGASKPRSNEPPKSEDEKPSISEPTTITDAGTKIWKNKDGEFHREDGPAVEYADGTKTWLINGEHHREDGPAVEYADGTKTWYINGEILTEEEFNAWRKKNKK
jgi:hypothetical protein